jgi:hypothetical protein
MDYMERFRERHPGYWTAYNRENNERRRRQWRQYYLRKREELLVKKREAYKAKKEAGAPATQE